jgi:hypothetical protein
MTVPSPAIPGNDVVAADLIRLALDFDPVSNLAGMKPSVSGKYIRFDDAAAALAQKDRELADTKDALRECRAQAVMLGEMYEAAERALSTIRAEAMQQAENIALNFECSLVSYDSDEDKNYYEAGVLDASGGIAAAIRTAANQGEKR